MRRDVVLVALASCGGGQPQPANKPAAPVEHKVTRLPIEEKDEEPADGVAIVQTKGHMEKEAIEAGLASHTDALTSCYTKKVGKRRWLGGHVVLHWDIKGDGAITSVKMTESDLGAWAVEKCLLDVAREARFEKPIGGDTEFTVPLDFSARGGTQIWDEDKALRVIGGQLAQIEACSEPPKPPKPPRHPVKKAKKPKPAPPVAAAKPVRPERPPTNVTITLYVGPQGKAQSVGFSSTTSEIGELWAACAEKEALAWRLPDPRGQIAKLAVRYKAE